MEMDINKLYSNVRIGAQSSSSDARTVFQRDYDRIIFSSAFRRLQNKTQVFPLPGSVFVHNRLTHSLEVSSVGRSLGTLAGEFIESNYPSRLTDQSKEFYKYSLCNVLAAACLCHDIGNPAFGHSGEDAISSFFVENEQNTIDGKQTLKSFFTESEWQDFVHFEGNANAIRMLTQQQNGKSEGGLMLTVTTLASIAKYPCAAAASTKNILHRKKFGFFHAEENTFTSIAHSTQMIQESTNPIIFKRHPFVWLTEAADDICYNIIDLEDAHRLGIIDHRSCESLLLSIYGELEDSKLPKLKERVHAIENNNDKIGLLRAKCIGALTFQAIEHYKNNFEKIIQGALDMPLMELIKKQSPALKNVEKFSIQNIYNHHSVVEIENAGYNVLHELLNHFLFPTLKRKENRTQKDKKALTLVPLQFKYESASPYMQTLGILDYISGMTDNYAVELYRKIKGIQIGMNQ